MFPEPRRVSGTYPTGWCSIRTATRTASRPEASARDVAPNSPTRRTAVAPVAWPRSECSRLAVPFGQAIAWLAIALPTQDGQMQNPLLAELTCFQLTHDLPGAHDQDPIAHRDHLWKLGGDEQHRGSTLHYFIDQFVDLVLRATV